MIVASSRLASIHLPMLPPPEAALPLSNIPAYLPPYLLRPDLAMTLAR